MTEEVVDKIRSLRNHAYKMGSIDLAVQLDSALLVAYRDRTLCSSANAPGHESQPGEQPSRA